MANFFKATPKNKQVMKTLILTVSRIDQQGCGVAYYGKKPVFIEGTLIDEVVEVNVVEQKNKYWRAKLLKIQTVNSARTEPKCEYFHRCGGCNLQHMSYYEQLKFKQDKVTQLFSRYQIDDSLPWQHALASDEWQYRRKARIGVQYNKLGEAIIGFRQQESNQLTPIKYCPVLVSEFAEVFAELNILLPQVSGKNAIGHIEAISANKQVLVVRQLAKMTKNDHKLWLNLAKRKQWLVYIDNGQSIEPITDNHTLSYWVTDTIEINFRVDDFIQVNHKVNQQMVAQAIDWLALQKDDLVLDLFCGLGNFTLPIAEQVQRVVGVEGVQTMVEQAQANALHNGLGNCQFYQANLNNNWQQYPWQELPFTKAILDPARAGAYQAIEQLVIYKIPVIVYVSCDPATLAKDSQLLIKHGYKIEKITLMDMFSQTKHVETMVMFSLS